MTSILVSLTLIILLSYSRAFKVYEKHRNLGHVNVFAKSIGTFIGTLALIIIPLLAISIILTKEINSRTNIKNDKVSDTIFSNIDSSKIKSIPIQ